MSTLDTYVAFFLLGLTALSVVVFAVWLLATLKRGPTDFWNRPPPQGW